MDALERLFNIFPPSPLLSQPASRSVPSQPFSSSPSKRILTQATPGVLRKRFVGNSEGDEAVCETIQPSLDKKKKKPRDRSSKGCSCRAVWYAFAAALIGLYVVGSLVILPEDGCYLVTSFGWGCEEHVVTTGDGFQLSLKRVGKRGKGDPVLFVHGEALRIEQVDVRVMLSVELGLSDSSATFVLSGPEHSLVGALVRQGYDVWLGDTRGRSPFLHETEHSGSSKYWDYSIDDLVEFDIPRMVSYVHQEAGRDIAAIIAHSQGGLLSLISLANQPKTAEKVKAFVGLQPPLAFGLRSSALPGNGVANFLRGAFETALHPPHIFSFARRIMSGLCVILPSLCAEVVCFAAGCASSDFFDADTLVKVFSYYPKETSWKNLQHLLQCEHSQKIQKFDYGEEENLNKYGQASPPHYSFEALSTRVALFYGTTDRLVSSSHAMHVRALLPEKALSVLNDSLPYGHADFIWSKDAKTNAYPRILDFIAGH